MIEREKRQTSGAVVHVTVQLPLLGGTRRKYCIPNSPTCKGRRSLGRVNPERSSVGKVPPNPKANQFFELKPNHLYKIHILLEFFFTIVLFFFLSMYFESDEQCQLVAFGRIRLCSNSLVRALSNLLISNVNTAK